MHKVSASDGSNQVHCVAHSFLKRTAQLSGIMQWMGLANDMSNPNFVPPTDSEIMMAYYNKMMAKQRWQKAGAALSALRAMRMAGGGAFGLKTPVKPAAPEPMPGYDSEGKRLPRHSLNEKMKKEQEAKAKEEAGLPDSPTESPVHPRISDSQGKRNARMSVSFVQDDKAAALVAKKTMGLLPKAHDVRDMLRSLIGSFCFAILDVKKDLILVACSEESEVTMLACVAADGTMFFGTDPDSLPADCTLLEVPKGTYFIGRYKGNGEEDLQFRKFAKVAVTAASEAA